MRAATDQHDGQISECAVKRFLMLESQRFVIDRAADRRSSPRILIGTKVLIKNQSIGEGDLHKRQRLARALGALAVLYAFCGLAGQSAYADGSVSSLRMGMGAPSAYAFGQFQSVIQQYNSSGERFRIDSHCQSACTMFLSIRNVCISPGATLLFHAGGSMQKGVIDASYTQQMLNTYNAALRDYVTANHFMDTFAFHSISGSEIIKRFGYPACR